MYPWFDQIYAQLEARISTNQLHHGLLFVADDGVGEQALINRLAKALVCEHQSACGKCKGCSLFDAQSHPDVKHVVSDKPSIGVDLIRKVSEFVATTAQLMGNKVIVINDIEKMTESASNSLLKTLEEPSANTFLLLSSTQPNALLATIKSRCEKIRLSLPTSEQSFAWLKQQTQQNVDEEGLRAYSHSPIYYLQALEDNSPDYHSFAADLEALSHNQAYPYSLAQKWKQDPAKALKWTYQWSVAQYLMLLHKDSSMHELSEIQELSDACIAVKPKIEQAGINTQLILQGIFNLVSQYRSH